MEVFPEGFSNQLANRWIKDFEQGLDTIDGIFIRPCYVKLLLDKGELSAVDREMLIAAVKASNVTGMPIHCNILEAKMVKEVIGLIKNGIWVGIDCIR